MKNDLRRMLVCMLLLVLIISSCSATAEGTILPGETTATLTPVSESTDPMTPTGLSIVPLIPITGENVVSLQCQFCVDGETHAVLVFPDFAYFDVVAFTPVSCFTADVVNGRRILVCRGSQGTSFNLNICSDSTNCLQFPVALQECPLIQPGIPLVTSTAYTPVFLNPVNTLEARDDDSSQPDSTPVPSLPPPTSVTSEPPPTSEPTDPPAPTDEPTDEPKDPGDGQGKPTKKPSKTPKPPKEK